MCPLRLSASQKAHCNYVLGELLEFLFVFCIVAPWNLTSAIIPPLTPIFAVIRQSLKAPS